MTITESASLTTFPPLSDADYCICCDLWKPSCGKAIEQEQDRLERADQK